MTAPAPTGSRTLAFGLLGLLAAAPLVDAGTTYVPSTILRLGALSLALGSAWLAAGGHPRPSPSGADLPIVLFMALAGASALASDYTYLSLQAFHTLASAALVYAVTRETLREPGQTGAIRAVVIGVALAESALAVGQGVSGAGRPAGTYFNPNHLGLGLAMAACLLLAADPTTRARRVLQAAGLVLLAWALLLTRSRGAALATFAGCALAAWHRWRWRAVAAGALVILLLVAVPNPLAERVRTLPASDPYAYTRLQIWGTALDRARDHPGGVGLNMFGPTSQFYAFEVPGELTRFGRRAGTAHNAYLQILAELGPVGLALALWAAGAVLLTARVRLGQEGTSDTVLLGACGGLVAFATQAVVDTPADVPGLILPAAALAGVVVGPGAAARPAEPAAGADRFRGVGRAAVALLALLALPLAARHGAAYLASARAAAAREAGDPGRALEWLALAERLAPDSAAYPDARAAIHLAAYMQSAEWAHVQAADAAMLRATDLDPLNSARLIKQAYVYTRVRDVPPAIVHRALVRAAELYDGVWRLNPYYTGHTVAHAETLMRLGRQAEAVAVLERAVRLEPNLLPNRLAFARVLADTGEIDRARGEYAAIEAVLAAYEASGRSDAFASLYLAVDRARVREEAARLGDRQS